MRTTLDLPDALARRVKLAAVQRGTTLKNLVTAALERDLDTASSKPSGRPLRFPLVRSRKPGALKLTPDEIHAILVREESAAYEVGLSLEPALLAAAKEIAAATHRGVGDVISELARKGLQRGGVSGKCRSRHGFPTFPMSNDAPPITGERVRRLLADEGLPPGR